MKILTLSIIIILAISVVSSGIAYAEITSGQALFMKSNSIGQIHANLTFPVLDNRTWDLTPSLTNLSDPNPIASKDLIIVASPNSITANKSNVPVTYSITAKNDIKGVYSLFLFFCGESPLVVGLNESKVNPAIFNQFFNAVYMCPMMNTATPELNIVSYSGMISKTISTIPSNANDLEIQNIQVHPSTIKVGDKLTINATLVNNSPNPIYLQYGVCGGHFSVAFDNHVTVDQKKLSCPLMLIQQKLDSGQKTTVTNPSTNYYTFRATSAGTANATVTFSYEVLDNITQSNISKTISKSFLFTIYENDTFVKSLKLENHPIINKIISPLKQFKSGVAANNIICRPDLQLLIQNQENFPICVKLDSVPNLLHRDWSYPTNCKYAHDPFTAGVAGLIIIENNASDPSSGKSYSPRNSTVVIGWNNTVSWINQDVTASSVTSDWNLFDSGPILPGADWHHNFECTGNYGYHSEPHPWMKGWIRVLPPSR